MTPKKIIAEKKPKAKTASAANTQLPDVQPGTNQLRRQAEAKLSRQKKKSQLIKEADAQRLLHEVQVHQIELEMQNEQLMQSQAEVEAGLKHYTDLYNDLYDFAPVGYFMLGNDGTIKRANLTAARLLGVMRGKLLKRRFGTFVSSESRLAFTDFLEQVFQNHGKETFEAALIKDEREILWAHLEAAIENDQREECRVVMVDITERKLAEIERQKRKEELELINDKLAQSQMEMKESFRQYADLYDFAPIGYFTLTRDTTIRQSNMAGANLLGVEPEQLTQHHLSGFVSIESRAAFNTFLEKLLSGEGQETCELAFQIKGDGVLWARLEATCFEGGDVCRITMTDVTERKRMEQILQESENRFRMLLQDVPKISIQGYAMDGTTQYWNSASEKLYGYSAQEALGQNLLDLIIPPEMRAGVKKAMQQMAETGEPIPASELSLMRKDGSRVSVYSSHASVSVPGRAHELFCIDLDLTERKQADALLQARVRISEFVEAHTFDELLQKTLDEAETLTGSQIGFAHMLEADQKTLHLQMWSTNTLKNMCRAEGKGKHYAVDQAGIWADCVSTRAPLIHNDYPNLTHRKGLPEGHAPILRELVIPVLRNGLVVMIMGVGNKPTDYNESDVETLSQLANSAWDIVQRKQAEDALRENQELFSLFMRHTPIYAFIKEVTPTQSRVLQASENYLNMIGIPGQDMMGKTMTELFPVESAAKFTDDDWSVVASGKVLKLDEELNGRYYNTIKFPIIQGNKTLLAGYTIDITERKLAEVELESMKEVLEKANIELQAALSLQKQLAHTDALTGINNRRHLYELAEHEFEIATRYIQPLAVIMFDIDHFKEVNDIFGHAIGDQMLQLVIKAASAELRSADVFGRYGGEEFVILLPMTNAKQAYPVAERIRNGVAALRMPTEKGEVSVTLSIGIIEIQHGAPNGSAENLIRYADQAMYAAKEAGRNRTEIRD